MSFWAAAPAAAVVLLTTGSGGAAPAAVVALLTTGSVGALPAAVVALLTTGSGGAAPAAVGADHGVRGGGRGEGEQYGHYLNKSCDGLVSHPDPPQTGEGATAILVVLCQ